MKLFQSTVVAVGALMALHANATSVTETFDSAPVFTYTGTGVLADHSITNVTKKPDGSTGNWLSIGKNKSETVTFSPGDWTEVSFLWGTVDSFNTLKLLSGSTVIDTITGKDFVGSLANGTKTFLFDYVYAGGITGLVLSSSGVAFELDNISVSAVPEPETYALMLAGIGAMAFVARRRQS